MDELMPVVDRLKDWNASIIIILSVLILVLYIITNTKYPDFYRSVFYRLFVENFSGRQISKPSEVSSIEALSTIISILSISTMFFTVVCYSEITNISLEYGVEWKTMLYILLGFAAYNFSRGLINLFFGVLFRLQNYAASYNTLILDTERTLSLIFLPIFAFCPFVSAKTAKILLLVALVSAIIMLLHICTLLLYRADFCNQSACFACC